MAEVYLSLGSNVGDRQKFLNNALVGLKKHLKNPTVSSFYQTEPWGNPNQSRFLNICVSGQTSLSPAELLDFISSIETGLGRIHREKWGPREIDIDILFYDDLVLKSPGLQIPHPQLEKRAFVLLPLEEIAPDLIHPLLKKSISDLAAQAPPGGVDKIKVQ